MSTPKVSVILPSYNHCRYLRQRIDSILGQTFRDFDLHILDDASTDETHRVLLRYYRHPLVRITVNTRNSGTAFAQWNRGIRLARGEYIWIAESDDAADPRFLESLVPVLDDDPQIGLAYCQSRLVNKDGTVIGDSLPWTDDLDQERWRSDFRNFGRDEVRDYLLSKNTIPNASAVLARRDRLLDIAPADTSYRLCGDWLHWGKLLLRADVAYVAEPLNDWRMDSSNSRLQPPGAVEWQEGQRVLTYLTQELGFTDADVNAVVLQFARRCLGWLTAATAANGKAAASPGATL